MLNARNIKLTFGTQIVLDDISFSLLPKDRIALVGQNGMGKSSLLRILTGEPPDNGAVELSKKNKIGFLKQIPDLDDDASVLETIRLGLTQHIENIYLHQRFCDDLTQDMDASSRKSLEKQIEILELQIQQRGGFDIDYMIERALTHLSIKARKQKMGVLSGGERRRVDLARILLSAPDIYLLDEPTNHLDIKAIQFLTSTIAKTHAAVLFVSHDSLFIDDLATKIIELDHGKIYTHAPPFANYLENKLVRESIEARSFHRRERLIANELSWLRAGTPARTTKQNARITRAYELMEQAVKDQELKRKKQLEIAMAKSNRLGNTIIELDQVGAVFSNRLLFENFNLKASAAQRYGILGPNGCGKTTLLKILAKKMPPSFGQITHGKNTQVIEFDQQRQQLDGALSLKETLVEHGDYVFFNGKNIHITSYLEKYLFSNHDANRKVNTLSGGEQNRLLLAKLFRQNANCLLLDEPTNDLDITSLAVLEEIIINYEGVVFLVSHDRRFLDRVCTAVIAFLSVEEGEAESKLVVFPGNYSDYARLNSRAQIQNPDVRSSKKMVGKRVKRVREKSRRSYKEERELQEMEKVIEKLEQERAGLHGELGDGELFRNDINMVQVKLKRLKETEEEIEKLYERWQRLLDMEG
jgi:ABC transport system ATP-binding/permease protein